jgi:signal transduction histidine kinase
MHSRLKRRLQELERERAVADERARIARDLHDDLGSSLVHVALLSDLAKDDQAPIEEKNQHVAEIGDTARQLVKTVHELVWATNPKNDVLPAVAGYLGQYAVDFLRHAGIQCLVKIPEELPRCPIPAAERHNLLLAVREAISNIAKHSRATQARLNLSVEQQSLLIELEDNGCGMGSTRVEGQGNGFGNMRDRLESIGGTCTFENNNGSGTRIVFRAPLAQPSHPLNGSQA